MRSSSIAGDVDEVDVPGLIPRTTVPATDDAVTFVMEDGESIEEDDEPIEVLLAAAACAAAELDLADRAIASIDATGSDVRATGTEAAPIDLSATDAAPSWPATSTSGLTVAILRIVIGVALLYGLAAWLGRAQ